MAEPKTQKNEASVVEFINSVEHEGKRQDSLALLEIFEACTGEKAVMWGSSIVGFGMYHYKSERSSQEGDWPLTGFSPRKQNLTIYISTGFESYGPQLQKLGKYTTSKGCLYIKRLSDVDIDVLKYIIKDSVKQMKKRYA